MAGNLKLSSIAASFVSSVFACLSLLAILDRMFLSGIAKNERERPRGEFPWSMKLFRELKELQLTSAVRFLVGENGSGKSTLIEAMAIGCRAVAAGSADLNHDETLWASHELARGFRFARKHHPGRTMFLRAEDVMGYSMRAAQLEREKDMTLEQLDAERVRDQILPRSGSPAQMKERLIRRLSYDPVDRSHGETFLDLLTARLGPGGLYFLDEPEAPLSPIRVLALLGLIKDRASDSQFVVATHSPILMALPDAQILLLENGRIEPIAYDEIEHVKLTRAFLGNPAKFLRHL